MGRVAGSSSDSPTAWSLPSPLCLGIGSVGGAVTTIREGRPGQEKGLGRQAWLLEMPLQPAD